MNSSITFEEKRYARDLIKESESMDSSVTKLIAGWGLIFAGGGIIVFVILSALLSPVSATTLPVSLIAGTSNGLIMLCLGSYLLHLHSAAKQKLVIASLLSKLLD